MKLNVLYEDNHLIAVLKPAGVLTQADKSGDINLMNEVKIYLKEKYQKPGNVFLGLLHRLDRPVSGIILFAKTGKGASRLSEQFRNKKVKKIYHALVIGKPKQNKGRLINYIKKDKKKNKAFIYKIKKADSQIPKVKKRVLPLRLAELYYEILTSNNKYSLLKVQPETGRFHQIRAQLSAIGCPILGDLKYGAPFILPDKNIALSATSLSFQLATKKETPKQNKVRYGARKKISIPFPTFWKRYIAI